MLDFKCQEGAINKKYSKSLFWNGQFGLQPRRVALEMQWASESLTFIVKGQVLSSNEKGLFQLDDYLVSFRILLHSWAPFYAAFVYKTCMQSHYIHAGSRSLHTHTHTHIHTHIYIYTLSAVRRLSAVCSMIWWKTWAGRSCVDHWLNLSPCDVYGSPCMCWGERGGTGSNRSNDRMKKEKKREKGVKDEKESYRMGTRWYEKRGEGQKVWEH